MGIYGFVFNRDGEWHDVIIDDQLFIVTPRWEALVDSVCDFKAIICYDNSTGYGTRSNDPCTTETVTCMKESVGKEERRFSLLDQSKTMKLGCK